METYSYQERMRRVLQHIESCLDEPPELEELASTACFSPYHFHRLFTAVMGESVAAYIRRLRLQRAAWRLSYSRLPVTEIALEAGYDRVEVFTRAFRSGFGMPPSTYRKKGGASAFSRVENPGACLFYHSHPEVDSVDIQIKKHPPVLVAALRHIGAYEACGPAWNTLCQAVATHKLMHADTVAYGVSYDDPDITPKEKCRMDVCVSLPKGMSENSPELAPLLRDGNISLRYIGSDREHAAILVKGPYSLLHPAYRSFFREWLPQSGREPDDTAGFEAYYNDPSTTAPEELLTEIFIPLKAKG